MLQSIVILGGHIQALGLARQAKSRGLNVILIAKDPFAISRYSKAVDYFHVCKTDNELNCLLRELQSKGVLLLPTSDEYIDFIYKDYDKYDSLFTLCLPSKSVINLFADKRKTYSFAQDNGIPHPKSWFPTSYEDVCRIAEIVEYPIVVKPAVMYSFHEIFRKKAFLCESRDNLLQRVKLIAESFPVDQLILQEFLSGGPKQLYSYGVLAMNGETLVSITANRIRQNPMDFGNSTTFAISCEIPEIEETAKRILQLTDYSGLAEVEFMYDKGQYKFLEINTRAWKWHSISTGRGFGFLSEWIDYINGAYSVKNECNKEMVAWVERLTDYTVSIKSIFRKRLKLKDIIASYCQRKVSAVWSIKDPLPALMYLIMSPILYIKRY